MEYIEHITLDGDRWDQIATLYYGDANRISPLGPPEDGSQRWAMWRCN